MVKSRGLEFSPNIVEKSPAASHSTEKQLEDKVAAIVEAFYHLKVKGRKKSLDGGG
jgi:hypothetical protein